MGEAAQLSSDVGAPPIGGWMVAVRPPDPRLKGLVAETSAYAEWSPGRRSRQHLPAPSIPVIINLEGRFATTDSSGGELVLGGCEGFVAGMHTTPASSTMEDLNAGVEILLSPLGAHQLLGGMPLSQLRDRVVTLDDLLGADAAEFLERLAEAEGPERRLALVEGFLLRKLALQERALPFEHAWRRLEKSGGTLRIRALAQELGWSEKRLTREFRRFTGLSPKTAARVMRFSRTLELAQTGQHDWTGISLRCGFHDQAHLIKEVQAFSGSTPTQLIGRILPEGGFSGDDVPLASQT